MEAGYDYLLVTRRRGVFRSMGQNPLPYALATLVVLGIIGAVIAGLFLFVFGGSTEDMEGESVATAAPTPAPVAEPVQTAQPTAAPPSTPAVTLVHPEPAPLPVAVSELSADLTREARLYPGSALKARYWPNPITFMPSTQFICTPGEASCDWAVPQRPAGLGQLPRPTRLIIPSIDVDSAIVQLRILDLGNYQQYDTPNNVVGHIPESANPGEEGSIWLFGHLESPIRNEGNVFAQLPEIPTMLRRGDEVYAVVENGSESFLYRIVESRVIPQEQLTLTYETAPQLFLVTPVPRNVYDHRLVVRGEWVGVKS